MSFLEDYALERCRRDLAELAKFPIGAKVRVIGPYASDWRGEYIVIGAQYEHREYVSHRFNIWIATEEELAKGHGASTELTPDELVLVQPQEAEPSPSQPENTDDRT